MAPSKYHLLYLPVAQNQPLTITGTGFSTTAADNKITFISTLDTSLTETVNASRVDVVGTAVRLTVTVPVFRDTRMRPDRMGTQYNVTVHIGNDITKVARGMNVQIFPP